MGAATSDLTGEDVRELQEISPFSARDIKDLYRRFRRLDRTHAGYLTSNEFQLIPELSMNPLCERIIALFDEDRSDRVNFRRFVRTLAVFHPQTPVADKLNVAFRCYDVDADGLISESDLLYVLKLLVGDNIDEAQVRVIARQAIRNATGSDTAPGITKAEFQKSVPNAEALGSLTFDLRQVRKGT